MSSTTAASSSRSGLSVSISAIVKVLEISLEWITEPEACLSATHQAQLIVYALLNLRIHLWPLEMLIRVFLRASIIAAIISFKWRLMPAGFCMATASAASPSAAASPARVVWLLL